MLDVVVLTLFEQMFQGVLEESILKRAQQNGLVRFQFVNFRDFAKDKHHTVDDTPFGGGAGMVLKPEPLFKAMESLEPRLDSKREARIVLTPQGKPFNQRMAEVLSNYDRIVLVCGHYEGFDERVIRGLVLSEVSVGDFVLTGGEIPAMAIIDAVVRLLPDALGNQASHQDDSFSTGLLEYPQYTRPAVCRGMSVPEVLLSGHHARIEKWRRAHALYRTWRRRPDLLRDAALSRQDSECIACFERGDFSAIEVRDDVSEDI